MDIFTAKTLIKNKAIEAGYPNVPTMGLMLEIVAELELKGEISAQEEEDLQDWVDDLFFPKN